MKYESLCVLLEQTNVNFNQMALVVDIFLNVKLLKNSPLIENLKI